MLSADNDLNIICLGASQQPNRSPSFDPMQNFNVLLKSARSVFGQEELALLFFLLLAAVVATFFIQHYKILWLPPSAAAMCLGILGGGVAWLMGVPH